MASDNSKIPFRALITYNKDAGYIWYFSDSKYCGAW